MTKYQILLKDYLGGWINMEIVETKDEAEAMKKANEMYPNQTLKVSIDKEQKV